MPFASLSSMDQVAEAYVKLVLAVGEHDDGYVDAYYGSEAWREEVTAWAPSLEELQRVAASVAAQLTALPAAAGDGELPALRRRYLESQLAALAARLEMLAGTRWSFDEESEALYDAVAPSHGDEHFQAVLDELDRILTGEGLTDGSFIERLEAFRRQFVIPPEKLEEVFRAAIDACRERAAAHIELPEGESFVVEYVNDKPWSGYNWYKGEFHSLIQVNVDLPIYIDRAIDLACHEGYPGHHLYNALLEKHLVRGRGWVEFSVYPLYSPQSLIAEGSANYGIEMAFPGDERLRFDREVLFPLAGLDPRQAAAYHEVLALTAKLGYAGNEAARRYLDGEIDAAAAAEWLSRYAATEPDRAAQRVRFFDAYRSYVINYNLGKDLVQRYVEARAGDSEEERWRVFSELLSSPRLPSGLR